MCIYLEKIKRQNNFPLTYKSTLLTSKQVLWEATCWGRCCSHFQKQYLTDSVFTLNISHRVTPDLTFGYLQTENRKWSIMPHWYFSAQNPFTATVSKVMTLFFKFFQVGNLDWKSADSSRFILIVSRHVELKKIIIFVKFSFHGETGWTEQS